MGGTPAWFVDVHTHTPAPPTPSPAAQPHTYVSTVAVAPPPTINVLPAPGMGGGLSLIPRGRCKSRCPVAVPWDPMPHVRACMLVSACIACGSLGVLPAATPASLSLSSDGTLVFVGTAQGEVVVVNSRGDAGTRASFQAFDAGTGVVVLPAVTPVPAGDTNPDSIAATAAQTPAPTAPAGAAAAAPAATPTPAVSAAAAAAAAPKKDSKAGKVKGVGFSTGLGSAGGGNGDGEDGSGTGRASGSKKPKPRAPPAVWSPVAAQRGWLVACGAVGPEGGALLRVLHWLPPSGEDLGVEWRHLASATLPSVPVSLNFSGDAR